MYAFVDQPVDRLCNGNRFLLWAMRAWISAAERRVCPSAALAPAFTGMGVGLMLRDFHMTMALLNRFGRDKISFSRMACPHVGEDEAVLLSLWSALSLDNRGQARAVIALLVDPAVMDPVEIAMTEGMSKLKEADLAPAPPSASAVMKEGK